MTVLPLFFVSLLSTVGSFYKPYGNPLLSTAVREVPMRIGAPFKMALFADLHFGEAQATDWGPLQDVNSTRVMNSVLHDEAPVLMHLIRPTTSISPPQHLLLQGALSWYIDQLTPVVFQSNFVIYLGDVITANNIMVTNASLYWDQAISPAKEKGIPWASVFGNHDDTPFVWPVEWFSAPGIPQIRCPPAGTSSSGEEDCSFKGTGRLELMKNEIKNSASYSSNGPRNLWPSVSNYVVQVSSPDDPQSPVAFLYFLDSGGGSYREVISSAQAEWFQQKAKEINADSRVPEIIFWHIPSTAYKEVAPNPDTSIQKPCVGSINMEVVAAQEAETGIMDLLVNRASVKAIFVGHNHGLDWCCPHKNLWLCYARHTGYGGYGTWPKGARILEITQKPFSLRSWIRMEDGSQHSEVVLSQV